MTKITVKGKITKKFKTGKMEFGKKIKQISFPTIPIAPP